MIRLIDVGRSTLNMDGSINMVCVLDGIKRKIQLRRSMYSLFLFPDCRCMETDQLPPGFVHRDKHCAHKAFLLYVVFY